uniref:Uncharacterized protein n=1 Tax=Oryza sativa subsp. japonica TaxID=39947 RepID=Q6Z5J1_ORYSJ|nr:hypothetical protein [Oryza sativa Japonica Group]
MFVKPFRPNPVLGSSNHLAMHVVGKWRGGDESTSKLIVQQLGKIRQSKRPGAAATSCQCIMQPHAIVETPGDYRHVIWLP